MRNLKLLYSVIFILLVSFSLVFTQNVNLKKEIELQSLKSHDLNIRLEQFAGKDRILNSSEFSILNKKMKIINLNGDTIKITDVIKSNTLVFRYSMTNCGACINQEMENIRNLKYQKRIDTDKIIFLAYYQNLRDQIVSYRSMDLNIPIYILTENDLGLPIEKKNFPYYFVVDSTLCLRNLFIPERNDAELTMKYVEKICNNVLK